VSAPLNPVEVETNIRTISDRIAKGVSVCDQRYRDFLAADHQYDLAYASAYLAADGPQHERKYRAELATAGLRQARDVADAAFRYADRQAKALEAELRAMQSVNASIRAMYQVAGVGER
jgi:hypothetical protein